MKLKFPKNYYKWQPELSVSIIYWCWTFGIFFLSAITALENNDVNLLSIIIMVIFLFFFILGQQRYFLIQGNELILHAVLKSHSCKIPIESIEKILIGSHGITIVYHHTHIVDTKKNIMFIMRKKESSRFLKHLEKMPTFSGKIENYDMHESEM